MKQTSIRASNGPLLQRVDILSPGVIGDPAQDRSGPFTLIRPGVRGADHNIDLLCASFLDGTLGKAS